MVHQSWVRGGADTIRDGLALTNFGNDWDGDLIYVYNAGIDYWQLTPITQQYFTYTTREIDFGEPSVEKKIHKVYINYKGDCSLLQVHYLYNGETNKSNKRQFTIVGGADTATPLINASSATIWTKAELKPTTHPSDLTSISLLIGGHTDLANKGIEIGDMTIVYRMKGIK